MTPRDWDEFTPDDPELVDIVGGDPELLTLGRRLRASRPEPAAGPHFQAYLRARLLDAAATQLRPRGLSRWWRPRSGWLAAGGAGLGVAMAAAAVAAITLYRGHDVVPGGYSPLVGRATVDPGSVILVSFTEPMDQAAVVQGLKIHPATAYTTHWDSSTRLVITPVHHLAANTPYTVIIDHHAVRDVRGTTAATDLRIPFGTASSPTPAPAPVPAQPPGLSGQAVAAVAPDSPVLFAPDGSPVAGAGSIASTTSPTPAPTSGPTGIPSLTVPPLPPGSRSAPSSAASGAPAKSALTRYPTDASPAPLGPAATEVAYSPSGRLIAYLQQDRTGATLWVAQTDGSGAARLTHIDNASSPLAWSAEDTLLAVNGSQITSIALSGQSHTLAHGLRLGGGQAVAFVPQGKLAYIGPAQSSTSSAAPATSTPGAAQAPASAGELVDLSTGTVTALAGSSSTPTFGQDGGTAVWVDASGATPRFQTAPTASGTSSTLPVKTTAGDAVGSVALSHDGTRLAYVITHRDGSAQLIVAAVGSGAVAAAGDGAGISGISWAPDDGRLGWLGRTATGASAFTATVPPGKQQQPQPATPTIPPAAITAIDRFLAAQASADTSTVRELAPSLDPATLVPGRTDPRSPLRHYISQLSLAADGLSVVARARLIRDPSVDHPRAASVDETLTLTPGPSGYAVSAAPPERIVLRDVPNGPQVVHAGWQHRDGELEISIALDSDIDPDTVAAAVGATAPDGNPLLTTATYDAGSRTIDIVIHDLPHGAATVTVGQALRDIDGQQLDAPYSINAGS
jgi:hypothetical protein